MQKTFVVQSTDAMLRLDVFLSKALKISRAKAQNIIHANNVLLNQNIVKASACLKTNDKIIINFPEDNNAKKTISDSLNIPILYESEDVLVINKPRGIAVHPDTKYKDNTVVNWAIKYYPPIVKIGEDATRPGIVHRLDKETSGVMILAKTQIMFEWLKRAFHDRFVKKQYLVLVNGNFPESIKFVDLDIGRSPTKARQIAITSNRAKQKSIKTRLAKTEFKILKNFKNYTLIKALPLSGRTHQIRVHLASTGHSVVGDKIYGKKQANSLNKGAMLLHSQILAIPFPDGTIHKWNAPLPNDFETTLKNLED